MSADWSTNQARQGCHRVLIQNASMFDCHASAIIGPLLVQGAQDTDTVCCRFKHTAVNILFL